MVRKFERDGIGCDEHQIEKNLDKTSLNWFQYKNNNLNNQSKSNFQCTTELKYTYNYDLCKYLEQDIERNAYFKVGSVF